jgi:hypothetical protein
MSVESPGRDRSGIRLAWLPTALLAGLGIAGGYYLAGPDDNPRAAGTGNGRPPLATGAESAPPTEKHVGATDQSDVAVEPHVQPRAAKLRRFSLTAADVKDTQGAPDIAVDGEDNVYIVWASITGETEQTAFLARSATGSDGFSEPQAVVRSAIAYRSAGNGKKGYAIRLAPHVVAHGDAISLSWSEAVADGTTVRMVLLKSTDRCETFSAPLCVHESPQARPTFTGLAIGSQGELACCWLDGREATQHPYASVRRAGQDKILPEMRVPGGEHDKGVCPCCPTCATFAPDGTLFVAFRNLVDGYRDLAIARLRPGEQQFDGPFAVVPPTWKFDGCPHDGPSLVVVDNQLHVAWMDAHTGLQRAYYGRAALDTLQFQVQPLHADGPGTQGNPKLYADSRGVHAVWEESLANESATIAAGGHQHGPTTGGAGRGIRYALAPPGAEAFKSPRLIHPIAGTYQSRPAIVGDARNQIYVAWCELDQKGKSIVVTSVSHDVETQVSQRGSP